MKKKKAFPNKYLLGISCFYHDAAACLVHNGNIVVAIEEERLSRIKHDSEFPQRAIDACLKQAGITTNDLEMVVFYEKPFIKFERLLTMILAGFPNTSEYFKKMVSTWLISKLWIKNIIQEKLGITPDKIRFIPHHLSHAASTYYTSPFNEATVLTIDGVGEWSTAAWGVGKDLGLTLFEELRFPHSVGLLYAAITSFLGFEVNEGEYKVMGMAGFGRPRYLDKIKQLYTLYPDGSIFLNLKYFSFPYSTTRMYSKHLIRLLGKPRKPKTPFFNNQTGFIDYLGKKPDNSQDLIEQNQRYADIAASIQRATEEIILTMVKSIYSKTKIPNLCLAGGVALNGIINGRIINETGCKNIFIQPAAGDAGGAMGAALYGWYQLVDHTVSPTKVGEQKVFPHTFWELKSKSSEVEDEARKLTGVKITKLSRKKLLSYTAEKIKLGKIIGWYQDRGEWGARALGHRSILADPRNPKMKDIVNTTIKYREPFRPFAPSVCIEKATEYFEIDEFTLHYPAKFMTVVCSVKKNKRNLIPAVTHVDGTARVQTVDRVTNPLYYDLIKTFGDKTGVYVLLNTSFNLAGEPIVCSTKDAISAFLRSGLDILVIENIVIEK